AQVEIEKQRLADLHQEKDECIADFRHKVENSIEPYNLNRYNLYIEKIKERIKLQMAQLARAEALMKAKRAELIEAMKDRKILDTLKEKEYEAYLDEEKKNEQKILDDLVSYKYRTG
ncbi:MAG: flagellar export protein FliJ, partial [Defluviitaleaceae bacterium]|nr:flagellar export protein FliJ [Defluviitaleaceae bacterium]